MNGELTKIDPAEHPELVELDAKMSAELAKLDQIEATEVIVPDTDTETKSDVDLALLDAEMDEHLSKQESVDGGELVRVGQDSGKEVAIIEEKPETILHAVLVNQEKDAIRSARAEAAALRTERLNKSGSKVAKFTRSIWDNITGEFKEQQDVAAGRRRRGETNSVDGVERKPGEVDRSAKSTIDRFKDFSLDFEELVHTDAGEKITEATEDDPTAKAIKELIELNVRGTMTDEVFENMKNRLLTIQKREGSKDYNPVQADNLLEIRDAVRGAVEHGESLERVLANMKISLGESNGGVRSEARLGRIHEAMERFQRTKVGSMISPEALTGVASVAIIGLKLGSHRFVGALAMTAVPGASAALFAGLREWNRIGDERTQHSAEMAQGGTIEAGSKRRERLEATRFETKSATSLEEELRSRIEILKADGSTIEEIDNAINAIAAAKARKNIGNAQHADLISFSSPEAVEEERLAYDMALAEAKVAARELLKDNLELRKQLKIDEKLDINEIIAQRAKDEELLLTTDIKEKNKSFSRYRMGRTAVAAGVGLLSGLTLGIVSQEVVASIDPSRLSLFEKLMDAKPPAGGTEHQTLLAGIVTGDKATANHEFTSFKLGETKDALNVSGDSSIRYNPDNTFSIIGPDGHVSAADLQANPDGTLPPETLDALKGHGMHVIDTSSTIETHQTVEKNLSTKEFVDAHAEDMVRMHIDVQNNNDTYKFDKNELGLQLGANNGITENGGYQFHVDMTENGSYHNGVHVSWRDAAEKGDFKIAISASDSTQDKVFLVNVDPTTGNANIEPGSPAAKLFSNENGRMVFHGGFAEAVIDGGPDKDGTHHIQTLATVIGQNDLHEIRDTVTEQVTSHVPHYEIIPPAPDAFTEMAPAPVIMGRRNMEQVAYAEPTPETPSSEVLPDPETDLVAIEQLPKLERAIATRELEGVYEPGQYAGEIEAASKRIAIESTTDKVVNLPVIEADADGVYRIFSDPNLKEAASKSDSTFVVSMNWSVDTSGTIESKPEVVRMREYVADLKAQNPDMNVTVVDKGWTSEQVAKLNETEDGFKSEATKRAMDAAAKAVGDALEAGRLGKDHDPLLFVVDPKGEVEATLAQIDAITGLRVDRKKSDIIISSSELGEKTPADAVVRSIDANTRRLAATLGTGIPVVNKKSIAAIQESAYAAIGGFDQRNRTASPAGTMAAQIRGVRGATSTRTPVATTKTISSREALEFDQEAWDKVDSDFDSVRTKIEDEINEYVRMNIGNINSVRLNLDITYPIYNRNGTRTKSFTLHKVRETDGSDGYRFSFSEHGANRLRERLYKEAARKKIVSRRVTRPQGAPDVI